MCVCEWRKCVTVCKNIDSITHLPTGKETECNTEGGGATHSSLSLSPMERAVESCSIQYKYESPHILDMSLYIHWSSLL